MIIKQKVTVIILGYLFAVILLELGLRIGGFVFSSLQEHRNITSLKQKGTYRIMCLGESTTAFGGECSWSARLEEILNERAAGMKFSVINKGVVSIDTNYILQHLGENLNKYNPDMVITMMGLNDRDAATVNKDIPIKTYRLVRLLRKNIIDEIRKTEIYKQSIKFKQTIEKNQKSADAYTRLGWRYQNDKKYNEAEKTFKKAIELNPKNDRAYFELGACYKEQVKYDEAEKTFKKAIELNPKNDLAYFELGRCYKERGKYDEAEETFKKVIELNPRNDLAYFELGRCYKEQVKYDEAEKTFKKSIEQNPENDLAYFELGCCYIEQGKFEKAGTIFKKTIELHPQNDKIYFELGRYYRKQLKYDKAEEMLKKSIELNPWDPRNDRAYFELGRCYRDQKEYDKAEAILKKAIEQNPKNDKAYDELAVLYETMGKYETARENHKKADEIRLQNYSSMTRNNYYKLKRILDKRGIKLVCVQYPMRSVEILKKMLEPYKDIVFVDNEKLFKDALRQGNYDECFTDTCYVDFGHCTPKSNRLLAENIANVILKECFSEKK